MLAKGKTTQEVVEATGYSRSWIYELVWGYNRIGAKTLGDQRHSNQGSSQPLLDDVQQALLWQVLQEPPIEGGTSDQVEIPEGIHLEFLPSHSPELQPAERLWTLTNEPIANRSFDSLAQVEEALIKRCCQIIDQPDESSGFN